MAQLHKWLRYCCSLMGRKWIIFHYTIYNVRRQVDTWVCQKINKKTFSRNFWIVTRSILQTVCIYYTARKPEAVLQLYLTPQPLPVYCCSNSIIGTYLITILYYGHVIGNFNTRPPIIKSLLSTAIARSILSVVYRSVSLLQNIIGLGTWSAPPTPENRSVWALPMLCHCL